ncbi:MAG: chloramphenicol acetyltransferase [Bacteroidaceae bacterium]|nr:chloramphenicol acetyltransferase [Bacteroidaceae bacterium]
MKQEIDPKETNRKEAFEHWMSSPMPMVTLMKTIDVSRLRKVSRKQGIKFTALLCWCICKAASSIEEFFLLPEPGHLYRYDKLAVNVIVLNDKGGITSCDVPYSEDIRQFNADYLKVTSLAAKTCKSTSLEDAMIIGTSALPHIELDCIVNQYSGRWNNPFLAWGKYRKSLFKTTVPISLQFHHAQMDGMQACRFLDNLQHEIKRIR